MEKKELIKNLKEILSNLKVLKSRCAKCTGTQIQSKDILLELELIATRWYEQIEPILRSLYGFAEDDIQDSKESFGNLLEISGTRPSKQTVVKILATLIGTFPREVIVPVQKHSGILSKFEIFDVILSVVEGLEKEFLTEAFDCAKSGKLRAAIILGWCAAINRLHLHIMNEGLEKFNKASVQMAGITSGRYKRFNKKYEVQNLSDLRMTVFDNDLLWVLEFLQFIDGNQHERLEICFTMRNTSAHPGETIVSEENILSYFSDLDKLVFSNSKFKI